MQKNLSSLVCDILKCPTFIDIFLWDCWQHDASNMTKCFINRGSKLGTKMKCFVNRDQSWAQRWNDGKWITCRSVSIKNTTSKFIGKDKVWYYDLTFDLLPKILLDATKFSFRFSPHEDSQRSVLTVSTLTLYQYRIVIDLFHKIRQHSADILSTKIQIFITPLYRLLANKRSLSVHITQSEYRYQSMPVKILIRRSNSLIFVIWDFKRIKQESLQSVFWCDFLMYVWGWRFLQLRGAVYVIFDS
jgi:hypothetical protein